MKRAFAPALTQFCIWDYLREKRNGRGRSRDWSTGPGWDVDVGDGHLDALRLP